MLVHRLGVHALAAPGFSLEPLLGSELTEDAAHVLGMVLSRELGFNAYFLTPYDGGTGLTLIRDKRLVPVERRPLARIMIVFPQVIDALTVHDHRVAFASYVHDYGFDAIDIPGGIRVSQGKDVIVAHFDDRNRLTGIEGTVTAEPPRPARSAARKKPAKKTAKKVARKPVPKASRKPLKTATRKKPARKLARSAGKKR
jgi:hypothetical protein